MGPRARGRRIEHGTVILGIGTDIVSLARVHGILEDFRGRFPRRILTDRELAWFHGAAQPAAFLARRFAAKEAAAKALGTGIRAPFTFNAIEVRREAGRPPELHFRGAAGTEARRQGVTRALLTLSDERDYAVAFVILLRE